MLHPLRQGFGGRVFWLAGKEAPIVLEHQCTRRTPGHDGVIARKRSQVLPRPLLRQVSMPVGFDWRSGASLRGQIRLDAMLAEEGDDRIAAAVREIIACSPMKVCDLGTRHLAGGRHETRIALA